MRVLILPLSGILEDVCEQAHAGTPGLRTQSLGERKWKSCKLLEQKGKFSDLGAK